MRVLVLCLVLALSAGAVEIETLAGRQLRGAQLAFVEDQVTVDGTSVPVARCAWIGAETGSPATQPELGLAPYGVRLRGAGHLPALRIDPGTHPDRILVTSPLGSFDLPLSAVRAWGTRSQLTAPSDRQEQDLLILQRGHQVRGRIRAVREAGVVLVTDLDEEPLVFPLEDVRAVFIAHGDAVEEPGLRLRLVHDPALPPLYLAARLPWQLVGLPNTRVEPALPLPRLEVIGGDRVALSDLEPETVEERGAFSVVWPWARDRQIDGGPIRVRGRLYERGIVVHSFARLQWRLDGHYERFRALVAIVDSMGYEGDCEVTIAVDGEQRWHRRVRGMDEPLPVDVDSRGATTLTLTVDFGERFDIGDHVAFADAHLIRRAR